MNQLQQLIEQDFPFIEIEKLIDIEASEDNKVITALVLTTNGMVYSLYLDKEEIKPILQRHI